MPAYPACSHATARGTTWAVGRKVTDWWKRTWRPTGGRRGPTARAVFSVGLERWVGYLVRLLPGASEARRRDAALARIATMVGAVAIARALDDQSLADEILAAARIAVLADYAVPEGQSR